MSIHPETGDLIAGLLLPRIQNMDKIPSPYLSGLMDQWFDGSHIPSIEMTRGCPFSCSYCFVGSQCYYKKLASFSVERIKQDLDYIAQRMSKYPDVLLGICDSNFGTYPHDEEIARHIGKLQDKLSWPNGFDVNTGKTNHEHILKIITILKNKMALTTSVQSLNPKTLEAINRRNIPLEEYRKINNEIIKRGMGSATETIVPMPEETKESFFDGLRLIANEIGFDRVVPHTLMLLKGAQLASKETRDKYKMQTKFRIIPRQFGEYLGEKCFEIEEICVATNTLPFDDYLEIRGFSFISAFFMNNQFDIIHRHLKELGISNYDYFYHIWELVKSGKSPLTEIYNKFLEETKEELWDSPEDIYHYFSQPENYEKLVNGKLGDNLIRKYRTKLYLEQCVPAIESAYVAIEGVANGVITDEIARSLDAAKSWMIALRNVDDVLKSKFQRDTNESMHLSYDVQKWYCDGDASATLLTYKKPTSYKIFCDNEKIQRALTKTKELYGGDPFFQVSKLLIDWDISNFWRQCEDYFFIAPNSEDKLK